MKRDMSEPLKTNRSRYPLQEMICRVLVLIVASQIFVIGSFHQMSRGFPDFIYRNTNLNSDPFHVFNTRPVTFHMYNSRQAWSDSRIFSRISLDGFEMDTSYGDNTSHLSPPIDDLELDRLHLKFEKNESCRRFDWASHSFPTCNQFHEMDRAPFSNHLAKGGVRDVWLIEQDGETSKGFTTEKKNNTVMKTLRYNKEFFVKFYEMHRVDSLISERLSGMSASVDIYGSCANSAIYEGIESTILEVDVHKLSSIEKLQIAYELSFSLGQAHYSLSSRSDEAAVIHRDITVKNFVVTQDKKYKINDFNSGHILGNCEFVKKECKGYRSPEECSGLALSEKIDVYSFGFVLHFLITGMVPSKYGSKTDLIVKNSFVMSNANKYNDPALEVIQETVKLCFIKDPKDRPSSIILAQKLRQVLDTINSNNNKNNINK